MKRVIFHGAEATVLPGHGIIEPGLIELPDELAAALIAAGAKTGDYSDPGAEPTEETPVAIEADHDAPRWRRKE